MVEKYVSLSYSFVKFEIGSVFLDGSPYPSDERTAKVGKTGIKNKEQARKNAERMANQEWLTREWATL